MSDSHNLFAGANLLWGNYRATITVTVLLTVGLRLFMVQRVGSVRPRALPTEIYNPSDKTDSL